MYIQKSIERLKKERWGRLKQERWGIQKAQIKKKGKVQV
jgi:hypothetical protein